MTEHEANANFCDFIKRNFGFEPVPIHLPNLNSLYRERATFFIHNADQTRELGFHWHGYCERNIMIAPFHDYNDDEAFEYFDYELLDSKNDFTRLDTDFVDWNDEEEDISLFDDVFAFQKAYYVVTDYTVPVGVEDLI